MPQLTKEQYDKISFLRTHSALYSFQTKVLFEVFFEVYNWSPGCSTCPGPVQIAKDRLRPLVDEYFNWLQEQEQEQQQEEPKPQVKQEKPKGRPRKEQ